MLSRNDNSANARETVLSFRLVDCDPAIEGMTIAKIRALLARIPGPQRPVLEMTRASRETIQQAGEVPDP